jgi:transposase
VPTYTAPQVPFPMRGRREIDARFDSGEVSRVYASSSAAAPVSATAPAPIFLDTDLGLNRVWKTEWAMLNKKDGSGVAPGSLEGARSATGGEPGAAVEVKRWSAGRKKEVVLRLLRGEPVDAISREVSVPIFKLEQWRDRALAGIDAGLKERENDPVAQQLDDANRRIGELVMEVEILQKERRAKRPLVGRRSSR